MSASNPSSISRLFASPPPPAAVEISARRVTVVAVAASGAERTVTSHTTESLPDGAVTPALNGVNVHDEAALAGALTQAIERVTPKPRRVALILPDTVAKVSLLRFEKIPAKAQDLEQLVRWQMRKAVPFRIEDAQISWLPAVELDGGGREYLVLAARRDIVQSYERACEAAGVHAGIVDIASLNLVNAVLAADPAGATGDSSTGAGLSRAPSRDDPSTSSGSSRAPSRDDWLLVHAATEYATLIVVRNGRVIFYRNRPSEGAVQDMGDLVHQTAMYFEDRLGGTAFSRVILAGSAATDTGGEVIRQQIEERLGARVDRLDVRSSVTVRDQAAGASSPDRLDALAPAVGVLLRDRPVAAGRGREQVA